MSLLQEKFETVLLTIVELKKHNLLKEYFSFISFLQSELISGSTGNMLVESIPYKSSKSRLNLRKNRYSNIFPFDYNRVCLGDSRRPPAFTSVPTLHVDYFGNEDGDSLLGLKKSLVDLGISDPGSNSDSISQPSLNLNPDIELNRINNTEASSKLASGSALGPGLESEPGYINASWIQPPKSLGLDDLNFIAIQGPTRETVGDFWQVAYEQKTPLVVMLANLVENGSNKCYQYWPAKSGTSYDFKDKNLGLKVTNAGEKTILDGIAIIRKFLVQPTASHNKNSVHTTAVAASVPHTVYQLHYLRWQDCSVPSSFKETLQVLDTARQYILKQKENCTGAVASGTGTHISSLSGWNNSIDSVAVMNKGGSVSVSESEPNAPPIVHCSAGCGRTGTFIVLYTILELYHRRKSASKDDYAGDLIMDLVVVYRLQRVYMVQTFDQFMFLYYFMYYCLEKRIIKI